MTDQNQPIEEQKVEVVTIPVTFFGNGNVRQIELSKKQWSLTRENNDRWLFTEVRP